MKRVSVGQARSHLRELMVEACEGEEVIIARDAKSAVRLSPVLKPDQRRKSHVSRVALDARFFDPLLPEELGDW